MICNALKHSSAQVIVHPTPQIPILAWGGVPPNEASVARFEEMKAAGLSLSLTRITSADSMEIMLEMAEKAGVKLIVRCTGLQEDPENIVRRFKNNPAVAGYYLKDEPSAFEVADLADLAKRINAVDDKNFCYLNLLPNYASKSQLGSFSYREYVDLYASKVSTRFLSFDHYPIVEDSSGKHCRKNWYENLEIIADEAGKTGKPFWAFALSVAHGIYPVPTIGELRLQVYSNLAYGAQGIQYFTYWTPKNKTQYNYRNGPITDDTKQRTEVYDRIKMVNQEIQNLAGVFYGAKVISVAHTGAMIPKGTKRLDKLPSIIKNFATEGEGAVVSLLGKGNEKFLVIVNRDFMKTMKLTVDADTSLHRVLIDGSIVQASDYIKTLEIDPGAVAIYKWKSSTVKEIIGK